MIATDFVFFYVYLNDSNLPQFAGDDVYQREVGSLLVDCDLYNCQIVYCLHTSDCLQIFKHSRLWYGDCTTLFFHVCVRRDFFFAI